MQLDVIRYSDNGESTLGLLMVNGKFQCYTLEDELRSVKVFGETRIPDGEYIIGIRSVGGHHNRYKKKFPNNHIGMLEVEDVPNFKYVLIHIGNNDDDTAGCLLVGNKSNNNSFNEGFISDSTSAYKDLYVAVISAINKGEQVCIKYVSI